MAAGIAYLACGVSGQALLNDRPPSRTARIVVIVCSSPRIDAKVSQSFCRAGTCRRRSATLANDELLVRIADMTRSWAKRTRYRTSGRKRAAESLPCRVGSKHRARYGDCSRYSCLNARLKQVAVGDVLRRNDFAPGTFRAATRCTRKWDRSLLIGPSSKARRSELSDWQKWRGIAVRAPHWNDRLAYDQYIEQHVELRVRNKSLEACWSNQNHDRPIHRS